MNVEEMTDELLLASVKHYAAREREATAALEGRLRAIDARTRACAKGGRGASMERSRPARRRAGGGAGD